MTTMADDASIPVRPHTKKLLEAAKAPGESFDAVIRRVLTKAQAAKEIDVLREVNALLADRKAMRPLR